MKKLFRFLAWILILVLRVINLWLFIIPSRFTILALVFYFFVYNWIVGDQEFYLFKRELGGAGSWQNGLFAIFILFPIFYSWICMFTAVKTGDKINATLDDAINFRNGQMRISTPQNAFKILQKSSSLDVLKANQENKIYADANIGFRALHGNDSPQKIYKGFIDDSNK